MSVKWIGAILIVAGCGGWGLALSNAYRMQEKQLRKLSRILHTMQWELKFRLTDLPKLCRMAARESSGVLKNIFLDLAREMEWNTQPDVSGCMSEVLRRYDTLCPRVKRILRQLGRSLGRFDLEGQLQELDYVMAECRREIKTLEKDKERKLRNYKTLGFCAGCALVILFI